MHVPANTLHILAAVVWYIGGFVLLLKARSLLVEADGLRPGQPWPWVAIVAGVFVGALKAKFIFTKSCLRNQARIDALERPRIWQFFRPQFFLLLALMITAGTTLSRQAHHNYAFLLGVAWLDLTIATALLTSSYVFWKKRVLAQ